MDNLLQYLFANHSTKVLVGSVGIGLTGLYAVLSRRLVRTQPFESEWARALAAGKRATLITILFCVIDSLLLLLPPLVGASFAPNIDSWMGFYISIRLGLFLGVLGAMALANWRRERGIVWGGGSRSSRSSRRQLGTFFVLVNVSMSAVMVDAYLIEPLSVETTELELVVGAVREQPPHIVPLRILHLTDSHIARYGPREAQIVKEVRRLAPDIILMTGDYLNVSYLGDPQAEADWRRFASELEAPYGIFAVRGTVEQSREGMARLLDGTDVIWLEQEAVDVEVRGQAVTLIGVACSHDQERDTARLDEALEGVSRRGALQSAPTILLYHSPDLILEAAERGVEWVLGGHTHGGQVRLPFIGAVVTLSKFGRTYAAGLYEESGTQMVVSRGIGLEGGNAPRVRFLCRPEIVSIDLVGL